MKHRLALLPLLAALGLPATAAAAKIPLKNDAWIGVSGYMQPWAYLPIDTEEGGVTPDLYLRRAFFFVNGKPSEKTSFFFGGMATNLGKAGEPNLTFNVIDAWFEYNHSTAFNLDVGFFRVPFTRHHLVAGSKLHGLDFHTAFIKQSGIASLRDVGIQARGLVMDEHLEYRVAVMDGGEPNTINAVPRLMARATYHVFDADKGLKVWASHQGQKKMLSFAGAVDLEPSAGADGDELSWSAAFDALADLPMGDNGIVATATYQIHGPNGSMPEGMGCWGDLGYRIGKIEPLVATEWYQPSEGDTGQLLAMMGGVNWWARGHKANVKLQGGASQVDGSDSWSPEVILQGQFAF